jgi:glycerol-3-phosphate cytidylyltransferase
MNVITYGTFDTFHYGHLELLKKCKNYGDRLIVGLSTDNFNLIKGKKSIFNYNQRKKWLESIKYVDIIIPEESWEQKEKDILDYNIDYFVIGNDWSGKFDYLKCKVIYINRTEGISSTKIKNIIN